ncbi:hypothetical protein [Peribacillus tepidiphilus]|uniref:hypothetical protein n=1 Tax=Peribacillus tepidiphilus TaxID=2652445 RepID=UPI0012916162|nr:hypothetical protein [Peribacillus tepidiphilus]
MWKNLVMSVINFVRNFKDTSTLKYFKKKVEMGDIMQHIFKKLEEDKAIKKVIYMLMAMGYAYYEVRQIREIFKKDSFREIAKPAIKRISYEMKVRKSGAKWPLEKRCCRNHCSD